MNIRNAYTKVIIEGVPLSVWYEYDRDQGAIEKISVYVPNDNREEYDLYELITAEKHIKKITEAIEEDVNHG